MLPRWGPYPLGGPKTISGKSTCPNPAPGPGEKIDHLGSKWKLCEGDACVNNRRPRVFRRLTRRRFTAGEEPEDQRGSSLVHAKSPHPDASGCVASGRSLTLVSAASKVSCPKLPVQW